MLRNYPTDPKFQMFTSKFFLSIGHVICNPKVLASCVFLLCLQVEAIELKLYYEERELQPFYLGASPTPPAENPGISIEMIRMLDEAMDEIEIKYIRTPWKRALQSLEAGNADFVIASYSKEREKIGVFPTKNGLPDEQRAFMINAYCLFTESSSDFAWNRRRFSLTPTSPVSVPQGYSIIGLLQQHEIPIVETQSTEAAFELLHKERASGAVTFCETGWDYLNQLPNGLETYKQHPHLRRAVGFLLFSHQFYQRHKILVEKMWNEVQKVRSNHYPKLLEQYEFRYNKKLN